MEKFGRDVSRKKALKTLSSLVFDYLAYSLFNDFNYFDGRILFHPERGDPVSAGQKCQLSGQKMAILELFQHF